MAQCASLIAPYGYYSYAHAGACVPSGTLGRAQCGGVSLMRAA